VSFRREQAVSKNYRHRFARHVYVERYPRIEMVKIRDDDGLSRPGVRSDIARKS
jgi:hypothetical protein